MQHVEWTCSFIQESWFTEKPIYKVTQLGVMYLMFEITTKILENKLQSNNCDSGIFDNRHAVECLTTVNRHDPDGPNQN